MSAAHVVRLEPLALREFVRVHQVCFEASAHRDLGPNGVVAVGYDVVLLARCPRGPADPGSGDVIEVFEHLVQLAEAALPRDVWGAVHIEPFEPAFHLRPEMDWTPEVRLVLEVVRHEHGYFDPIDSEERTCVRRIESALEAWGVQPGVWRAPRKK